MVVVVYRELHPCGAGRCTHTHTVAMCVYVSECKTAIVKFHEGRKEDGKMKESERVEGVGGHLE